MTLSRRVRDLMRPLTERLLRRPTVSIPPWVPPARITKRVGSKIRIERDLPLNEYELYYSDGSKMHRELLQQLIRILGPDDQEQLITCEPIARMLAQDIDPDAIRFVLVWGQMIEVTLKPGYEPTDELCDQLLEVVTGHAVDYQSI